MKILRLVALGCLLAALSLGIWYLARRPGERPQEDTAAPAFRVQPLAGGALLEYAEDQVPLRAIAWVQGRQPGLLFAQVITQNDRQQLTVFDHGQTLATLALARPQEASEGFFRFAELKDAALLEGRRALLLYGPGNGRTEEESLLLLVDLLGQAPTWAHRVRADRMVHEASLDPDGVYLFGTASPLLKARFPGAGKAGHPNLELVDLPAEVEDISSLLPTGPGTFLAAHARGLSAHLGAKGWVHHAAPERTGQVFKEVRPALVSAGGSIWWQPSPGRLFKVAKDGGGPAEIPLGAALAGSPLELDAGLLRLLGTDPSGDLWFGLEPPLAQVPAPAQATEPAKPPTPDTAPLEESPPTSPAEAPPGPSPEERAKLEEFLKGGLSRVYRWNPRKMTLRLYSWKARWDALGRPGGFPPPEGSGGLRPESDGLLAGGERRVAWIPLSALGPGEDLAQPK